MFYFVHNLFFPKQWFLSIKYIIMLMFAFRK